MKRIPPEIHVVEVEPLPAHHLEALKELVRLIFDSWTAHLKTAPNNISHLAAF